MKMKTSSIVDIARDQLTGAAGGVHVVAGIKNAKTGLWESKVEFEAPGPQVLGPPTIPASFTHGIWDVKKNDWLWKQEVHYKRYPPGTVDEMGRPK
jgi:hypothetical protein